MAFPNFAGKHAHDARQPCFLIARKLALVCSG